MQEAQNDGDAQVGDAAADQGGDGFTLVGQKKRKKREPNNASKTPLAPRKDYVRLAFPEGTTKKEKMKWLQDLGNPSSNLRGKPIDLVRGDTLSSPYIYVARSQQSYIENLTGGLIGGITFKSCDEKKKSEKYDEYLVTHYNKDLDLDNAYALDGVHKAIRVYKDGQPLNRIRIVWKGEQPPPSTYNFFGKYMPTSHVRPWRASPVICYNCMGSGHVAKYCKDKARCAACGEQHSAKECPRSAAGREPAADAPSFVPSCFRCGKAGVTAWHWGCTALPALAPPPPPPVAAAPTASAQRGPPCPGPSPPPTVAPAPTASDQRGPPNPTRGQRAGGVPSRAVCDVTSRRDFPGLSASGDAEVAELRDTVALLKEQVDKMMLIITELKTATPLPPQAPAEAAVPHPRAGMTAGLAGESPAKPCGRSDVTPADHSDINVQELLKEIKALRQENNNLRQDKEKMNRDCHCRDTSAAISVKETSEQIRCHDISADNQSGRVSADSSDEHYHDPCGTESDEESSDVTSPPGTPGTTTEGTVLRSGTKLRPNI